MINIMINMIIIVFVDDFIDIIFMNNFIFFCLSEIFETF